MTLSLRPTLTACGLLGAALALSTACPDEHEHEHEHGANIPCDEDTRDEEYSPGMEKETDEGRMTVVLEEAVPGPIDLGSNAWTISVADPTSGDPESGCTITAVPWMTDHNHGSNSPVATESDTAGTYEISDLQVTMAGLWDTTLSLECPNLGDDTVHFVFCIEG